MLATIIAATGKILLAFSSCCAYVYKGNFGSGVKDKGMRQSTNVFSKGGKWKKNLEERILGEGEKRKRPVGPVKDTTVAVIYLVILPLYCVLES